VGHGLAPDRPAGVFVWAGGVKAPKLVVGSGLPIGHNGRVNVDQYLCVLDHPEVYVAGDLASVVDPRSGHVLPPLVQVALEEGETVARNLDAELEGRSLGCSPSMTRGLSYRSGPAAGSPTSPASPAADGSPTCSRTSSSGSTPAVRHAPARLGPSSLVTAAILLRATTLEYGSRRDLRGCGSRWGRVDGYRQDR